MNVQKTSLLTLVLLISACHFALAQVVIFDNTPLDEPKIFGNRISTVTHHNGPNAFYPGIDVNGVKSSVKVVKH
jgi:hypothetical protein